jgi:tetratricopeptide (TPR) repeat protein
MAVFGLPQVHEDDALRAVRAAAEMRAALARLNDELEREYGVRLANRTGVNTGEVVAGEVNAGQRLVTGDAVNVAARLEQAAPELEVLIGEATYRLVRHAVEVEALEPLAVKGKAERVPAYRLLRVLGATEALRPEEGVLVGREKELAALRGAFAEVATRSACRVATLAGEPGIGKSRLARELLAAVASEARVVRGRCLSYGQGITFWPLVEIVREAASLDATDPPEGAREKLASLLPAAPEVASRVAAAVGLADGEFSLDEIYRGARMFFERLASERPLVVFVDDVHWAEDAFLDLLEHLAGSAQAPILVLCAARPELFERRPGWAEARWAVAVALEPLSDEQSARVIDDRLGEGGLPDRVRQRLVQAADGNPLYVEQLISMLVDEGHLRRDNGRWEATDKLEQLAIPGTIQGLLAARLEVLAPEERAVIDAASVIGVEFEQDAVKHLAPETLDDRMASILGGLAEKQLIRRVPGERDDASPRFRFHHVLIRDTAYQGLLKRTRAALHERLVEWADRAHRELEYEEIVGYHLEQAHRYLVELSSGDERARAIGARACDVLTRAGGRTWRRGDVAATAGLLTRAIDLMEARDPRRAMLLLDIGDAMLLAGRYEEMEAALGRVSEVAAEAGDDRSALLAQLSLTTHRVVFDALGVDLDAALEKGRSALDRFQADGDDLGIARACRLLFHANEVQGQYGAAASVQERGIDPARRAGDVFLRFDLGNLALAHIRGPTPTSLGIARSRELLELARDDRLTAACISTELGLGHALRGEIELGRTLVQGAIAAFEESGHVRDTAEMRRDLAAVEALAGDWSASESAAREMYKIAVATGERALLAESAMLVGESLLRQGRPTDAEQFASIANAEAACLRRFPLTGLRRLQARLCASRGAYPDALRLSREAVRIAAGTDSLWARADALMDLAGVLDETGRPVDARKVLRQALRSYQQKEHLVGMERARALLAAGSATERATGCADALPTSA